jgi:septum site-determining protein MinD
MTKIVSVHSFRGGTGKSNITANLAALSAKTGKTVGVVDTDIASPGIHVLFGMDTDAMSKSLNDYLWGRCAVEDAAYDVTAQLEKEASGGEILGRLFLIPCSIQAGDIVKVLKEGYDVGILNDGFRGLAERLKLDALFIDTHPGLNEETLLSIAISDLLLLVMRPDQQDFQGTAVTVEVARKLDVPELRILVNKVLEEFDDEDVRKSVEETYESSVAAVLPLSEDIVRLSSAGLFCLRNPEHVFTHKLRSIVENVL